MPHKIGLYIRVSTEEQAMRTEGSLESQKHRLNGYIDLKNMQQPDWGKAVEQYVDDGFSAKDTNRPALQRLLRDLEKGRVTMVLVTDLSRLSRSIRDFCGLLDIFKDTQAKFLSLKEQFDTSTAAGEMMLFNMINLAQFERRQISERVSLNFHSRALRGLRNGGSIPLGFKVNPRNKAVLEINPDEVGYVKTIFNEYLISGSLYRTAAKLRQERIPSRPINSKPNGNLPTIWNVQSLANMLKNFHYAGLREVNKGNKNKNPESLMAHEKYQVVPAAWDAIIDETTFMAVQQMLEENGKLARQKHKSGTKRSFLATGIAFCKECCRALVGSTGHGRATDVRYYIHRPIEGKPVTCTVKRYRAEEVEAEVVNHLSKVVNREGYLDGLENTFQQIIGASEDTFFSQKRDLERSVTQADAEIKKLIKMQLQFDDDSLGEIYLDALKELKDQRIKDKDQLEILCRQSRDHISAKAMREVVELNLKNFQKAWSKSDPNLQKKLLRSVIARLVLSQDGIDLYYHSSKTKIENGNCTTEIGSTGNKPVDLAEVRKAKAQRLAALALSSTGFAHNSKVSGWYNVKNGCGGRI